MVNGSSTTSPGDLATFDDKRLGYDRLVLQIILAQLPIVALLAPLGYGTYVFAIVASVLLAGATGIAYVQFRGTPLFGIFCGPILMSISVIAIQAQLGRIEMHFHIFGALALLLIFKDWRPILSAAGFIAVHHLLFTALQLSDTSLGGMAIMIFNYGCNWGITFLHAAFVVFESAILMYYAVLMEREKARAEELVDAVSRVTAESDLTVRVAAQEDDEVADAFNGLLVDFEGLLRDMGDATRELNGISSEMLVSSQATWDNLSNQNTQISNARDAMTEMSSAIQDVAKNAQMAATVTQSTDEDARNGAVMVSGAITSSKNLMNSMNEASASIASLSEAATRIGTVVDVIREISEQTNLLALNATIEAARAGEQGRGFAVVADEVRELALRTRKSTEEIQDIIGSLQSLTQSVVEDINAGVENSAHTSEEISRAGEVLSAITAAVSQISDMNNINAASAEQQSVTTLSISDNIQLVSDLSQGTVDNIESEQRIAAQLNELAMALEQKVSKYRCQ